MSDTAIRFIYNQSNSLLDWDLLTDSINEYCRMTKQEIPMWYYKICNRYIETEEHIAHYLKLKYPSCVEIK